jgi:hypothetical protein
MNMKKLLTAIALAGLIATPAFAASSHHQTTLSARPLYMYAPGPSGDYAPAQSGDARADALRECNEAAGKWSEQAWESTQSAVYGTCMTEHGQQP